MSRFHGPQPGFKFDRRPGQKKGPKGVLRAYRAELREDAEKRDKETKPEDRRQARLARLKEEEGE